MNVKIKFEGGVNESYPVQVSAKSVYVLENNESLRNINILQGDGSYSQELLKQSTLNIIVSNQSFEVPTIKLKGYVENSQCFQGNYEVKNQHTYSNYYAKLEPGKYPFKVESEDGATWSDTMEIKEDKDALWMYITYWNTEGNPKISVMQSYEMIGLD